MNKKHTFWIIVSHHRNRQREYGYVVEGTLSDRRKDAIRKIVEGIYANTVSEHAKRIMSQPISKTWKEELKDSYSVQKISFIIKQTV